MNDVKIPIWRMQRPQEVIRTLQKYSPERCLKVVISLMVSGTVDQVAMAANAMKTLRLCEQESIRDKA
jgi:hypothetical protein